MTVHLGRGWGMGENIGRWEWGGQDRGDGGDNIEDPVYI